MLTELNWALLTLDTICLLGALSTCFAKGKGVNKLNKSRKDKDSCFLLLLREGLHGPMLKPYFLCSVFIVHQLSCTHCAGLGTDWNVCHYIGLTEHFLILYFHWHNDIIMTVMVYDRACSDALSSAGFYISTFIFLTFHFKYNSFWGSGKKKCRLYVIISKCLHLNPM